MRNVTEKQENRDWIVLIRRLKKKKRVCKQFMWLVKNIFCIYKMYLISANGYENVGVNLLRVKKTGEIWEKHERFTRWFRG